MKAKVKCRGINVELNNVTKYTVKAPGTQHSQLEIFNGSKRIATFHHWSYIILEVE